MRASTLLNAVLELPGVRVSKAAVVGGEVRVTVRLRRRRLGCPRCGFSTRHRYDTRDVDSSWRHLDMAGRVCRIVLRRRRLRCPEHGVRTEGVPFARDGSGHTRDFEDPVAWLVTKTDKTTVAGFARTSWRHRRRDLRTGRGRRARPEPAVRAGRHRCRRDLLAHAPPV